LLFFVTHEAISQTWNATIEVTEPRTNIYKWDDKTFKERVNAGKKAALFYPVDVSDLMIPYRPLKAYFETTPNDPVRKLIFELTQTITNFKSMDDVFGWLGTHKFPEDEIQLEFPDTLPHLSAEEKELTMGATIIHTKNGEALTFGCAACHSHDLFGVKVLGLTNRFPRANEFFRYGQQFAPYVNSFIFKDLLQTTEGERLMMVDAKNAVRWVGTKKPQAVGLDTSLAQVALSLSKRGLDEYATKHAFWADFPRPNRLSKRIADSKPAVWWNVKYKNRWLSDGSIISGNPIHTNFLWNEIGRGTDLKKLEIWLNENQKTIENLTASVFATQAPRYENFFGENAIDLSKAQRGQKHFIQSCQKCHGTYQKGWDLPEADKLSKTEKIKTINLFYHKITPVIDVGTDPGRYEGMKAFYKDLNRLKISKTINTVVQPQKGYVPPPLEGIWARWPYFHNNSAPSLCAVLTAGKDRPKTYWAGEAKDKERDFDQECNGYPLGDNTPEEWKKDKDFLYNTKLEGLSNLGHDEGVFLKNGKEIYSFDEKLELVEFLKTL